MTKSFNCKALRAFRKLGAVALITATLSIFFAACNQTGGTGGGGELMTESLSMLSPLR